MGQNKGDMRTAASAGKYLRLQQSLADIIELVADQLTQVEQTITQGIPDLAQGLSSASQMKQLQSTLEQLLMVPAEKEASIVKDTLNQALTKSWQEERTWAQAREQALERAIANLLQAAWLGTGLKRQSILTEGLCKAQSLVGSKGGEIGDEKDT